MTPASHPSPRSGLAPETLSPTIRPADDFFRYVNGPWLDTHVIPDDRAGDGHFYRLRDLSEERVRAIIEDAPEDSQIGALYQSFMDVERCDALGTTPLEPDLAQIEAAETSDDLAVALGTLARTGIAGVDRARRLGGPRATPTAWCCGWARAASGFLTRRTTANPSTRRCGTSTSRTWIGWPRSPPTPSAATPSAARRSSPSSPPIAKHHWDIVKSREADLTYNPTTLDGLAESAPGFPWRAWADALRIPEEGRDKFVAQQPSFFEALSSLWPGGSAGLEP